MSPLFITSLFDVTPSLYRSSQRFAAFIIVIKDYFAPIDYFYVINENIYVFNDIIYDNKVQGDYKELISKPKPITRNTPHASANFYATYNAIYAIKDNISYVSKHIIVIRDAKYVIKDYFYAILSTIKSYQANFYTINNNFHVIKINNSSINAIYYVFICMMRVFMPFFYVINECYYAFNANFYVNNEVINVSIESDYENKEKSLRAMISKGAMRILRDLRKGMRVDWGYRGAIIT